MQLVDLLREQAVPMATLESRYGALLELVRRLIGVVPNCDPYLEIWPTAFRSYNVMVPNLLNLPLTIWGMGAPRATLGLAMYTASRVAGCAYCSAHTCSFALRRGASIDAVAHALDAEQASRTPAERAALAVATALARVPSDITDEQRQALTRELGAADAEWIVLGVAMMGFLNKFMDALGVPLEASTVQEVSGVIGASGWAPGKHWSDSAPTTGAPPRADTFATKLSVVRFAPSALRLDKRWTAGVPDRWPAVGEFLRARTGHDFPVLSRLRHRRAIRAIATMLRDNLDPSASALGLATKLSAGLVYADAIGNLADDLRALGAAPAPADAPALVVARAIAPSPAAVDETTVAAARALTPAQIVELVVFLSVLQLVHRLSSYFRA